MFQSLGRISAIALIVLSFLFAAGCQNKRHENSPWQLVDVTVDSSKINEPSSDTLYDFHLIYSFAGTGVNMGTKQPYFEIRDSLFVYSSRQTGTVQGQPALPTDTLREGVIRKSSIDSIITIVENAEDQKATRLNFSVPEGGMVFISVKTDALDFNYSFENCSDPTMKAIVAILNSYLNGEKLILYDYPCEDDMIQMSEDFLDSRQ
jgi:hypothetical protein